MFKRAPEVLRRPPETRKIDAELLDALRAFKEESGMSIDEQIRTAITDFKNVYMVSWRGWNETRAKSSHADNFVPKVAKISRKN